MIPSPVAPVTPFNVGTRIARHGRYAQGIFRIYRHVSQIKVTAGRHEGSFVGDDKAADQSVIRRNRGTDVPST
jgi:hypothetical protein